MLMFPEKLLPSSLGVSPTRLTATAAPKPLPTWMALPNDGWYPQSNPPLTAGGVNALASTARFGLDPLSAMDWLETLTAGAGASLLLDRSGKDLWFLHGAHVEALEEKKRLLAQYENMNPNKSFDDQMQDLFVQFVNTPWNMSSFQTALGTYLKKINDPGFSAFNQAAASYLNADTLVMSVRQIVQATGDQSRQMKIKFLVEHMGVFAGKIAQLLSNNQSVALPDNVRRVFETLKENGTPTRTLSQAQDRADQLYGDGVLTLTGLAGVGTVGETYYAIYHQNQPDEASVVMKVLKRSNHQQNGFRKEYLDQSTLDLERNVVRFALEWLLPASQQRDFYGKSVDVLFQGLSREIDYRYEYQGALDLAQSGRRFEVAKPFPPLGDKALGYSSDGRAVAIVYERAPGISLKKLMEMLSVYQEQGPARYRQQYQSLIEENLATVHGKPTAWLEDPSTWMRQIPKLYLQAFSEQALLLRHDGQAKTVHADPHPGNVFISLKPNGKPQLTYIDTGLTLEQKPEDVIQQLAFMMAVMFGQGEEIANQVLRDADYQPFLPGQNSLNPSGKSARPNPALDPFRDELARRLNAEMFGSGKMDPRDPNSFVSALSNVLQQMNVIQGSGQTLYYRALGLAFQNYMALSQLIFGHIGNPPQALGGDLLGGLGIASVIRHQQMGETLLRLAQMMTKSQENLRRAIVAGHIFSTVKPELPPEKSRL
ncbi:MAG: AarF/UbiB family protein [Candidatus Melainabacteria bacterium]|nr:AarF/UbiB family protein [Candidatus Melainabacteria bacterium]